MFIIVIVLTTRSSAIADNVTDACIGSTVYVCHNQ